VSEHVDISNEYRVVIMKIKLILGIFVLLLASSVQASTLRTAVTINGNEWAQISDSRGIVGEEVFNLCGLSSMCTGIASDGTDLTGWYWADLDQSLQLINDLLGTSISIGDLPGTFYQVDTTNWYNYFDYTFKDKYVGTNTWGYPSYYQTGTHGLLVQAPLDPQYWDCDNPPGTMVSCDLGIVQTFRSGADGWNTQGSYPSGFFLYKPSPVPVPAAVWLFGTALIGFVGMSRRRKVA
jgi:hypothetical protein